MGGRERGRIRVLTTKPPRRRTGAPWRAVWCRYVPHVRLAGAEAVVVPLRPPSFNCCDAPTEAKLRAAFALSPPPKVLFCNSPHNPTGHVATRQELELIAELCCAHDCIAVADEVRQPPPCFRALCALLARPLQLSLPFLPLPPFCVRC